MSTPWRSTRRQSGHSYSLNGRCKYGFHCTYFRKGTCTYFHPADDRDKLACSFGNVADALERSKSRWGLMVDGLAGEEVLGEAPLTGKATPLPTHVGITSERVLGSYSKLADNKIAVPGCPPVFTPPTRPLQLAPDADMDAPPFPVYKYGLEPLVRSVQCMSPGIDVLGGACDVVASAGSVYKLYAYLVGTLQMTMRFDMEVRRRPDGSGRGGVLLLQPWKGDPNHRLSYGYGNSFAAATCRFPEDLPASLRNSFSHHRVLYYELGGLRFAAHCEADAQYDPGKAKTPWKERGHLPSPPISPKMSMSTPASPKTKGSRFSVLMEDVDDDDDETDISSSTLTVDYPCGPSTAVPAAYLVEIKTYNATRLKQHAAIGVKSVRRYICQGPDSQLYFGRTPQLYETGQENGAFTPNTSVENVRERLEKWEADNQQNLQRLVAFLRDTINRASAHAAEGRTRLSLVLPSGRDASCEDMRARLYIRNDGVSFLPDA